MNWLDESIITKTGKHVILRAETDQGEWQVTRGCGEVKLTSVSYGSKRDGSGRIFGFPEEIARFGDVEEALIAVDIWENPGELTDEKQAREQMGFQPYLEDLDKREYSKSTRILMGYDEVGQTLTISAKNREFIGLIYMRSPDSGREIQLPAISKQNTRDINAKILCTLLELRLEHPYNAGKGIRTPVTHEQRIAWQDTREQAGLIAKF